MHCSQTLLKRPIPARKIIGLVLIVFGTIGLTLFSPLLWFFVFPALTLLLLISAAGAACFRMRWPHSVDLMRRLAWIVSGLAAFGLLVASLISDGSWWLTSDGKAESWQDALLISVLIVVQLLWI